jgi:16S rRNA (cytidine1402-2'-O)-methyltransferase
MNNKSVGVIYVVATPLGNLADLSHRAVTILSQVDWVAAEDTRQTHKLFSHYGISTKLTALHGHNEQFKSASLIEKCLAGSNGALVSDAGTPLISDPGQVFVQQAVAAGVDVIPIPGACALIAALSVSGLDTSRFLFEGFLPVRTARRSKRLQYLSQQNMTIVFYEAKHRLHNFFTQLRGVFGRERKVVVARELTKKFEQVVRGSLQEVCDYFISNPELVRGEFVILVAGMADDQMVRSVDVASLLQELLHTLPVAKAASIVARLTGESKQVIYQRALEIKEQ